jgi:hypothetical protein
VVVSALLLPTPFFLCPSNLLHPLSLSLRVASASKKTSCCDNHHHQHIGVLFCSRFRPFLASSLLLYAIARLRRTKGISENKEPKGGNNLACLLGTMQRRMPLVRRSSSERFSSPDRAESDESLSQVQALSTSAASASSAATSDGVALLVKGKPLTAVVQVLADAILQQQAKFYRSREVAEARAQQTEMLLSDCRDKLGRLKDDLHLTHRPFFLHQPSSSGSLSRVEEERQNAFTSRRVYAAATLAEAVRLTHQQTQQLRLFVLQFAADTLMRKRKQGHLLELFSGWRQRGDRRITAKRLEATSTASVLATFYAKWRRRMASDWRQLQLSRERHLRAVIRRSKNTILSLYLRKWESFVTASSIQAAQLHAYQRRVAHMWSVRGPVITACKREFFDRWRQWTLARKAVRCSTLLHVQHADRHAVQLLKSSFALWRDKAKQRKLLQLRHRLARLMGAQSGQALLRRSWHLWVTYVDRARRLRRLEVLAADQHKRRVTALARRYFNELRYFRREQRFTRMMRSVEASLLMLADRVTDVEDAVLLQRELLPITVASPAGKLFASPPRPASVTPVREERGMPQAQWRSPATDEESLSRVEALFSRSR